MECSPNYLCSITNSYTGPHFRFAAGPVPVIGKVPNQRKMHFLFLTRREFPFTGDGDHWFVVREPP